MADDRPDLFDPTIRPKDARFRRAQPPSRWVGVLTPLAGLSAAVLRLEQGELVVGRDKDSDAVLADEGVSRRHARTVVVLDAGSGIRPMGAAWMKESIGAPLQAHLLFTHLHWDHIQGFPFFAPAYCKGNAFTVYGEARPGGIRELLSGQMHGAYFPVPLAAMQAKLSYRDTTPEFEVEGIKIRTFPLPHPVGCLGYRLEPDGSV